MNYLKFIVCLSTVGLFFLKLSGAPIEHVMPEELRKKTILEFQDFTQGPSAVLKFDFQTSNIQFLPKDAPLKKPIDSSFQSVLLSSVDVLKKTVELYPPRGVIAKNDNLYLMLHTGPVKNNSPIVVTINDKEYTVYLKDITKKSYTLMYEGEHLTLQFKDIIKVQAKKALKK